MSRVANKRPDRSKKTRVPMGARNRLSFSGLEEGYHYRVINDVDGRLGRAQEAGYEFVQSDERLGDVRVAEGSPVDSRVSKPVGNNTTGYLMRIKEEWYKEDQAEKQKKVDELEKSMQPDKTSNQYGEGLTKE